MISTRRAAEQLEQALTGSQAPDTGTTAGRRTATLVDVATAVASLPAQQIAPSADFRTALRARLDAEAAELSAARTVPPQRRPTPATTTVVRVGRKRQVLAGTVAAVLVSGTAAALASTSALPGDLLYPVKRGIEDVRGAVGGDAARAATELDFARERLDEAEQLVLRGQRGDVGAAEAALGDFGASAVNGTATLLAEYADDGDADHLLEVQDFVDDVVPQLERVRLESPEGLRSSIDALLRQMLDVGGGLDRTLASCGEPCHDAGVPGLDAATLAVLERSGSAPSAPSAQTPDASAAPAAPAVPDAPAVPGAPGPASGGVEIADDAGVGVDDGGLVASLPGVNGTVPMGPAGTTGPAAPVTPPSLPVSPDLPEPTVELPDLLEPTVEQPVDPGLPALGG